MFAGVDIDTGIDGKSPSPFLGVKASNDRLGLLR